MKKTMAMFSACLLMLSFLSGCADYAYRHHVSGRIIDASGQPVGGALVKRVVDRKSDRQFGAEWIYLQKTDMRGNFLFSYEGRGPKPEAREVWHLVVSHPDYLNKEVSLTVSWTDAEKPNFGYNLGGIEIKMTKAR